MTNIAADVSHMYEILGFPAPKKLYGFHVPGGQYQVHLEYEGDNLDIRDFTSRGEEVFQMLDITSDRVKVGGSQLGRHVNVHAFVELA